ncbi:hypothetical protein O7A70_29740 [Mesorhizobium sp. Cs1299R1N1]
MIRFATCPAAETVAAGIQQMASELLSEFPLMQDAPEFMPPQEMSYR